ncbi:MAG: DUF1634 domain-containing protein [Acidobacteriia bacterium]|nr:DUF1634 domain-containing protein [Terriglobia bacterium]
MAQLSDEKAQDAISAVLRYGSLLSAAVMAVGLGLALWKGEVLPRSGSLAARELLRSVPQLDPAGITELGILLLLLTPVFRVVVAGVSFGLERDFKYLLVSLGVFAVVLGSILYAIH